MLPPKSAIAAAMRRHHGAVQHMGEGMRAGRIRIDGQTKTYDAAIWRHNPEKPDLGDGGPVLKERIVFSIRKTLLPDPTLFFGGEEATGAKIIYVELGRAFVVQFAAQETPDHIAWQFEARRAPGLGPE